MTTTLARPSFTKFSVVPLTPRIGAELHGIDLREPLTDETIAEIRRALLAHKVISNAQNKTNCRQGDSQTTE